MLLENLSSSNLKNEKGALFCPFYRSKLQSKEMKQFFQSYKLCWPKQKIAQLHPKVHLLGYLMAWVWFLEPTWKERVGSPQAVFWPPRTGGLCTHRLYVISVKEKCIGRCWLQGIWILLSCHIGLPFPLEETRLTRVKCLPSSIAHVPPRLISFSQQLENLGPSHIGCSLIYWPPWRPVDLGTVHRLSGHCLLSSTSV